MASEKKKIIVTGATGLLGREIVKALRAVEGYEVLGTGFSRHGDGLVKLDLRDGAATKPFIVINAAAERRPDVCESDDTGSEALNIESVWHLARSSAYVGAHFIHISTDYVFDGTAPPYKEDAACNPLNVYGRQKVRGEYAALAAHPKPFVLRVPVLYGPTADVSESAITVFANTVRNAAEEKTLDDWQIRVPTYTLDVAATLRNVCEAYDKAGAELAGPSGIFHYSGEARLTRYAAATLIADILGLPSAHIKPDSNPPRGAPRPYDAQLDTSKLKALGLAHPSTPLREGLTAVLKP